MDEERQRFEAWADSQGITYARHKAWVGWRAAKADAKAQAEAVTAAPAAEAAPSEWPAWLQYDRAADLLTIHGMKYSGHVFESMAIAAPGTWLRITERRDGVLTVRTVDEQKEQLFTALADLPEGMVKAVIDPRPPLEQPTPDVRNWPGSRK